MQTEYVIRIGQLFVTTSSIKYARSIDLSPDQLNAARFSKVTIIDILKWLNLYAVNFQIHELTAEAKVVDQSLFITKQIDA